MNLLMNSMNGTWDIGTFLTNANTTLGTWGAAFIILIGTILIIMSIVKIFKAFTSQQGGAQWGTIIVMLLIGGAMVGGGWELISSIAEGGTQTIKDIGTGTTVLFNVFR